MPDSSVNAVSLLSLTWWVKAPILKLACPTCKKRTENYILEESETMVAVRCMKCGTVYNYDKTKSNGSDVVEDSPDLPCYG